MAKRFTAEEAANLIMNEDYDSGEMDSADSLDEEWSSTDEPTSQSDIESEDLDSSYSGRQVLVSSQSRTELKRRTARTRGGMARGARTRGSMARGIRTRGGSTRGLRARGSTNTLTQQQAGKRQRLNDESTQSSDSEAEDTATQDIDVTQDKDDDATLDKDDDVTPDSVDANENRDDSDVENNDSNNDEASEYVWSNTNPILKEFVFNDEHVGIKVDIPDKDDPSFFFNLFMTDDFWNNLVARSNEYAQRVINSSRPLRRKSVLNKWKEVTVSEMKQFVGLVFHMGLVSMPTYKSYWSEDRLYKNEMFKSVMPRDRFTSIMRFLNFGEEPATENDRLAKIRFLLNHLNNTVPELFTPDKELSLDESMMLWRGRLVFRQYIKNKRHKYGIKFFELCTNDGFVLKTEIYSGQKFQDPESLGQTGAIVLHLMAPYLDKGHHLFTDNWYNSVPLTKHMSLHKTYITGTLRADRKHLPNQVTKKKLKKGEMVSNSWEDISVIKWKDKRDVSMITNAFVPEFVESTNRHGKSKQKPNAVHVYNQNMSGIDRSDQMLSYHSGLRKTIRWYKKVGIHMFEIFMANSFYLYIKNTNKPKFNGMKDFKESIIRYLVGPPKPTKFTKPQANFHYLCPIPATEKKKTPTRVCKHCSIKGRRRESRYQCLRCPEQPTLCIDPCFRLYHQSIGVYESETSSSEE